jgi:hypothetical protein
MYFARNYPGQKVLWQKPFLLAILQMDYQRLNQPINMSQQNVGTGLHIALQTGIIHVLVNQTFFSFFLKLDDPLRYRANGHVNQKLL